MAANRDLAPNELTRGRFIWTREILLAEITRTKRVPCSNHDCEEGHDPNAHSEDPDADGRCAVCRDLCGTRGLHTQWVCGGDEGCHKRFNCKDALPASVTQDGTLFCGDCAKSDFHRDYAQSLRERAPIDPSDSKRGSFMRRLAAAHEAIAEGRS